MIRRAWVDDGEALAVVRQCALAGVSRSTIYARWDARKHPAVVSDGELLLCRLIDEEYTRRPFYGTRRMVVALATLGHTVNRKRVQRLMREMGLAGMAPGPNTSKASPEHKVYPYLLRGVAVVRPNQVWSTDITYIRLAHGFVYLVAVVDWYSRRVLSWRVSNSMEAVFCVDCLEDALRHHGKPEIFNSDQGSQFTSDGFTGVLKREGIAISMDGRGRAFDQAEGRRTPSGGPERSEGFGVAEHNIFVERLWRSVKYEDVYLKGYATMGELTLGLADYFAFYNGERPHQSLGNRTPLVVHESGQGGGAMIVDKFGAEARATARTTAKEGVECATVTA